MKERITVKNLIDILNELTQYQDYEISDISTTLITNKDTMKYQFKISVIINNEDVDFYIPVYKDEAKKLYNI